MRITDIGQEIALTPHPAELSRNFRALAPLRAVPFRP
jgi:hypothetical protein